MANRDGTGPNGKGPRTGRGLGDCPKADTPQAQTQPRPRRLGRR